MLHALLLSARTRSSPRTSRCDARGGRRVPRWGRLRRRGRDRGARGPAWSAAFARRARSLPFQGWQVELAATRRTQRSSSRKRSSSARSALPYCGRRVALGACARRARRDGRRARPDRDRVSAAASGWWPPPRRGPGFDVTATDYYDDALLFARRECLGERARAGADAATSTGVHFRQTSGATTWVLASDVLYERPYAARWSPRPWSVRWRRAARRSTPDPGARVSARRLPRREQAPRACWCGEAEPVPFAAGGDSTDDHRYSSSAGRP
jgi:hypothetical protein